MFKGNNRLVNFKPQNGQQVLVKARLSLYEPRGDYQIILESMQPEGDGRLQQQFEQLKMQLAAEGLFAQTRKNHCRKIHAAWGLSPHGLARLCTIFCTCLSAVTRICL